MNTVDLNMSLTIDSMPVAVTKTVFPAGESCIRVGDGGFDWGEETAYITFAFQGNQDLFDLALLVDAVRRKFNLQAIYLGMTYLPYARQDRVCNPGESLSIKVVADFINALKFDAVYCTDIHSAVGAALLDNLVHTPLNEAAHMLPSHELSSATTLVSPDAGAEKKVYDFAKAMGYDSMIRASKVRNVATGKIERTTLIDGLGVRYAAVHTFLIVDDICDGGRTFVELAKAIMNDEDYVGERICLYVTHGIFSAGLEELGRYFDRIYVHNLMNKDVENHPLIQIV